MDEDKLIRLEALRLAHEIQGANDPRSVQEIARDYEGYIRTGKFAGDKGQQGQTLPAPAGDDPPATDAPVARAKSVR